MRNIYTVPAFNMGFFYIPFYKKMHHKSTAVQFTSSHNLLETCRIFNCPRSSLH